jgi:hypothetical protein
MRCTKIDIGPASAEVRLHAREDEEAGMLEVESRIQRACKSGIDVDGNLVFDVD